MKTLLYCSTPNSRGIHQYSLLLYRTSLSFGYASHVYPSLACQFRNKLVSYILQILWELFHCTPAELFDVEIYSYPRLPIAALFCKKNLPIRGIVVHDFIQYVDDHSISSLFRLYNIFGPLELLKRLVHTAHFRLSLIRADFVLFNSQYTASLFKELFALSSRRLSGRSLILHPAPSFAPPAVVNAIDSLPSMINQSSIGIHIVSGFSPSKRSDILEHFLLKISNYSVGRNQNFHVNVFGYESTFLQNLVSENFSVYCHSGFVDESKLIVSCLTSHVFISTSDAEGFGIPLLDSMLFGLSCVCSPIPAYQEIVNTHPSLGDSVIFINGLSLEPDEEYFLAFIRAMSKFSDFSPAARAQAYLRRFRQIEERSAVSLKSFLLAQM